MLAGDPSGHHLLSPTMNWFLLNELMVRRLHVVARITTRFIDFESFRFVPRDSLETKKGGVEIVFALLSGRAPQFLLLITKVLLLIDSRLLIFNWTDHHAFISLRDKPTRPGGEAEREGGGECACQDELMGEVYAPMSADQAANLPPLVAPYLRISFPLLSRERLPP